MNKKQAVEEFKELYMPSLSKNDKPAMRQAWNDFTDYLCKDGRITSKQYARWIQPSFIDGRKKVKKIKGQN